MNKIIIKFSLGYLIVVTLLTSLIVYISFSTIKSHYIEASAKELLIYTELLESNIKSNNLQNDSTIVNHKIRQFTSKTNIRITILDNSGRVLYDSDGSPSKMENHLFRPEIVNANSDGTGQNIRFSNTVHDDMLYVARKFEPKGETHYIRASIFVSKMNYLLYEVRTDIIEISVLVYLISLLGLLLFIKNISNPIKQLSEASKKVAEGNFEVKIKIKSNDELGELSLNFNNMTKRLKKLFEKVNSQKEQLDTLVSEIQEGLVVIDTKGKIKLYNDSFSKLIGQSNLIGKNLTNLIEDEHFKKILKEVVSTDVSIMKEVEIRNKFYLCSTSWIKMKNEVIILLHDISELHKLETIKKDFAINVSHELRTPLTAIKGFSETLLEEIEDPEQKRYIDIISKHTNRLIRIVNDLLLLSELEETKNNLVLEKIKVNDLIDNVFNLFIQKGKDKNITLVKTVENSERILDIDNFRFEQLLVNLIDNAFNYTDSGKIELISTEYSNRQVFIIADTGLGIPEEDIERVFERFYTVDKSRSRRVGGTGLGLSIVKHIVLLHNGNIKIESKIQQGTKFIITIPFAQNTIQ